MKKTLYELIGVPPAAPREIVGAACKRRIARLEAQGGEEAKAAIYAIREAWHILGDDKTRAAYDASLASPQPEAFVDRQAAAFAAQIAPETLAQALVKPREVPRDWARIGKYAGGGMMALLFVSIFAVNHNARISAQKRIEAATYEAEHGEPLAARSAPAAAAKPAEPFSAEKAEQEMREREAAAREQVERDQQKQEDEFRRKLDQQNNPYSRGERRTRNR